MTADKRSSDQGEASKARLCMRQLLFQKRGTWHTVKHTHTHTHTHTAHCYTHTHTHITHTHTHSTLLHERPAGHTHTYTHGTHTHTAHCYTKDLQVTHTSQDLQARESRPR